MIGFFKCYYCKNYIHSEDVVPMCKAYPDGIPMEIFREEVDHTKPYPGDNGIQYEPREDM
jgi:hypothetical protein